MKKVSFDFDETLTLKSVQEYAKGLIKKGIDVHIVTTRYEDPSKYHFPCDHKDLFKVAKEIGIKKENIHFTNFNFKWNFFKDNPNFVWHLDDNYIEQQLMFANGCKTPCIIHKYGDYFENSCDNLLNEN
jgi:hypothetical protein